MMMKLIKLMSDKVKSTSKSCHDNDLKKLLSNKVRSTYESHMILNYI
jgi:hypothetical protein